VAVKQDHQGSPGISRDHQASLAGVELNYFTF